MRGSRDGFCGTGHCRHAAHHIRHRQVGADPNRTVEVREACDLRKNYGVADTGGAP
jgi:hypothetical protein